MALDPVALSAAHHITRHGEARSGGMAVFAWQDVLTELVYTALYRADQPQAGLLLGSVDTSHAAPSLYLQGFSDIGPFQSAERFVHELNQSWKPTRARIRRHSGQRLVGWVHSAPGSHGVLGPEDQLVHRSLFTHPYQLTLVVDALSHELGFYGADADGYLINVGFNLVSRK